jgi:PAS domain S-box-containing protein
MVHEDIRWRQQREAALRDPEGCFQAIFEQLPEGIVVHDPETMKVIHFNQAACRALGFTAEEYCQLSVWDYVAMEREEVASLVQQVLSHGTATFETRYRCKDGRVREVFVNAKLLVVAGKRLIMSVFRDVTEQRQAEWCYRALLDAIPDLVFRLRSDGTFLDYIPAKSSPPFLPPSEFLGRHIADVLPAKVAQGYMDRITKTLAYGNVQVYEYELVLPDGLRQYEARFAAIKADEVMVIIRDQTNVIQVENQLRKLYNDLAHVTRLSTLGEMAPLLAHELIQPLTAIANYLDTGLAEIRSGQFHCDRVCNMMESAAQEAIRAGEIIKRLRNLVQRTRPEGSSVNLNDLVQEVLALASPELRTNSIQVHLQLAESLPLIYVDRIQIQQVILNLVRNAMEAMLLSEPSQRILTLQTRYLYEEKKVELTVTDTGVGMDASAMLHLFEPFFTTKNTGMGMGLAISKNIVETHEGTLEAEPNPVGGMVFRILLPTFRFSERRPCT